VGLGRSAYVSRGFLPGRERTGDSGCPEDAEEGNVVSVRHKAYAPGTKGPKSQSPLGDASFARSSGPCASIVTKLRRRKPAGVTRSVRYRGRVNPCKREEPTPGSGRTDAVRLAACHRFREEGSVARKKRKEVKASVPARIKSPGWCPHVVTQLQKSSGERLVSNKLGSALQKEEAGRVNGGLERREVRGESFG